MIKFAIFFLSFLSNVLIIGAIPSEFLQLYVNIYTLIGGVSAFCFFVLYASYLTIYRVKFIGYSLFLFFLFAVSISDLLLATILFYPAVLIFNDYISTQNDNGEGKLAYRLFLILTALPFLVLDESFEIIFVLRFLLIMGILLLYAWFTKVIVPISVKSTPKYLFFNYTFYYVPLLVIANLNSTNNSLRLWYIFCQAGLVVYLKYLDYSLRHDHFVPVPLKNLIYISVFTIPLAPFLFYQDLIRLFVYYVGIFGLIYSGRFVTIRIK